jgi:hypothetical protein
VTPAWLWQADGPQMGTRGVVGDPGSARRLAGECLLSGVADSAVVEEAAAELGERTLIDGYHRTGRRWQATIGAHGRIGWTAMAAVNAA